MVDVGEVNYHHGYHFFYDGNRHCYDGNQKSVRFYGCRG